MVFLSESRKYIMNSFIYRGYWTSKLPLYLRLRHDLWKFIFSTLFKFVFRKIWKYFKIYAIKYIYHNRNGKTSHTERPFLVIIIIVFRINLIYFETMGFYTSSGHTRKFQFHIIAYESNLFKSPPHGVQACSRVVCHRKTTTVTHDVNIPLFSHFVFEIKHSELRY